MMQIDVQDLVFSYGGADVLQGVSFCADKGERIACLEARKHFAWYLRGVAHSGYYKNQITSLTTMEDIYRVAKDVVRDLK